MYIESDTPTVIDTPTRREYKPRGAFGLDLVSRDEYATPCGTGGIERDGQDWTAWSGDVVRTFTDMKSAAKFAKRGH